MALSRDPYAMMDTEDTVRVVTLTRFNISRALKIPEGNIDVRVEYLVDHMSSEMIATIEGLVDDLPENRTDYDYTNAWQRFKANHLPTFVGWGILSRSKMYRSRIVIRVCPHIEVVDKRNHFQFVMWED